MLLRAGIGLLLRRCSTMVSLVRRSSSARGKTVTCTRDELVQIACDESGYEGEKLIGGMTHVFAHASVRLDVESASMIGRTPCRNAVSAG
jgi:hypothetical protein